MGTVREVGQLLGKYLASKCNDSKQHDKKHREESAASY